MELVEKLPEKKLEQLVGDKKTDLFNSIVLGKDCIEEITTSKGKFKIKFPRMKDIEAIGRLVAYRLNGLNASSFDYNTYNLIQQIATLDVIVVEGPDWFENAKNDNPNFNWGEMPSQAFIQEVYGLAYNFRAEVQKQFEPKKESNTNAVATARDNSNSDGPGLFEGLASK